MAFVARPPTPALEPFVKSLFFVSLESLARPDAPADRVLPGGGTVELMIDLLDDEVLLDDGGPVRLRSGALVAGVRTRSYCVEPRRRMAIGVHFKPGGAFAFLGISPAEIVNAHVALADLWGTEGSLLREQLLEARSVESRFTLIERALLRRLVRARRRHPAVAGALEALRGEARVADVADLVGLGRRRLRDVFTCEVGVAPKLYARLHRFHGVKAYVASSPSVPAWAALAATAGYADQSHLIRDFIDFAGVSPSEYLRSSDGATRIDHQVHASH